MNFFDASLPFFRQNWGTAFRKRLGVYNYKIGHIQYHKKPGAIPLHIQQSLKKRNTPQAQIKIKQMEENSKRVFGKFTNKFTFDPSKVPVFDIPDLTGFELKPFVSVHTTQVEKQVLDSILKLNDFRDPKNFGRFTTIIDPTAASPNANQDQPPQTEKLQTEAKEN